MKQCFKCKATLPLAEFYRHAAMADGYLNKCKTCTKQDAHQHRHGEGRERVLDYDRKRSRLPHRTALRRAVSLDWMTNHPKERRAQNILSRAVRSGKVIPWEVCAVSDCDRKPEAHHPDYDAPLSVVWLCRAHHMQAHALMRKYTIEATP